RDGGGGGVRLGLSEDQEHHRLGADAHPGRLDLVRLPRGGGGEVHAVMHQIFLLSPANCAGKRATFLLGKNARSPLAQRLRSEDGATIGEVYTFMSGLYFRGKAAYASAFA